ncbi:MAG: DUF2232 domain-containing protein [Candidatus Cloacimonadia bacterium]
MNNLIFISLLSLFIAILSPFLGMIFLIAIGGSFIVKKGYQGKEILFLTLLIGLGLLNLFGVIAVPDMFEVFGGIVVVAWMTLSSFFKDKDFTKAFYIGSIWQLGYGVARWGLLKQTLTERIDLVFSGYEKLMQTEKLLSSMNEEQVIMMLEQVKSMMLNYQIAIWSISMILALYVGIHLLARRTGLSWNHQDMRLPNWIVYLLIITLILAVIPTLRTFGLNCLFSIIVLFVIQGLAIIDFWSKKFLHRSKFILFAATFLMFINILFALFIALLGFSDYWLDIRGLNRS